jgi:phage gpG-like protein
MGQIVEAKKVARREAERKQLANQLAGTLRAVLAERMVSAPTEEFEAVVLPDKEQLRTRRNGSNGNGNGNGSERLTQDRVREAFSRLDGRSSPRTGR